MNIAKSPNTSFQFSPSPCCRTKSDTSSVALKNVDIVCRIAIGIFGTFIAPAPLLISFGIGVIGGSVYAATRHIQNKPMYPNGQSKPVCAQGYMDFLSGMRFPPVVGTIATTAFIGAHMRHDPQFYAPFCGFFLGFWIGRESVTFCHDLAGRLKPAPRGSCCHSS